MTADFGEVTRAAVDDLLRLDPVLATSLGDHRWDDLLPDRTDGAVRDAVVALDDHLTALDAVDDVALPVEERVDLEILRARLTAVRFDLAEIRRRQWDPLSWNPSTAVHLLVAREFASPEDRLRSVVARLRDVPRFLSDARATLREMSRLHVETALGQLSGFGALLATAKALGDGAPVALRTSFAEAAEAAQGEVDRHVAWLAERLPESRWDPRLGVRLYSAALWHNLDEELTPVEVLEQAERRLDEVGELMREESARFLRGSPREPDIVRRALARIAAEAPVDDSSVLSVVREALARATRFVSVENLVSLPDVDTRVIEMPEFHRGVAVAYCDAPGPLETADVATFVAVSPTPAGWDAERVASFYREYNTVLLHDLTVHEAMPGHVLQLAHARGATHRSLVRRFGSSGVFAEGWAVYAEEIMAERGYAPDDGSNSALRLRLQQLKMQARMALNAILDARVHGGDIDETEALALLTRRGFQEEGEAVGKWRRALLTATQLPTYFVGWRGVTGIAADLRVLHPDWGDREIHDLMLSQGTVGPRHLRALLGL